MHPAFSVILFTTASGAGYGLLALMGTRVWHQSLPESFELRMVILVLGLGLVTAGLLSSTFHLGHPERAWRAFSQWRSSWLSREGVLAVVTYIPAGLLGLHWLLPDMVSLDERIAGLALAACSLMTVFATAMIYRSLKTIRQWSNKWTVPCYLVFSIMTGAILLNAILMVPGTMNPDMAFPAAILCLVGYAVKRCYWRFIDGTRAESTPASATGLNDMGEVRVFETPHSSDNYLLKEMGFSLGRKHAPKLRRIALWAGFIAPAALSAGAMTGGAVGTVSAVLAVVAVGTGIIAERWLFFAEARHVVTLYYGADRV